MERNHYTHHVIQEPGPVAPLTCSTMALPTLPNGWASMHVYVARSPPNARARTFLFFFLCFGLQIVISAAIASLTVGYNSSPWSPPVGYTSSEPSDQQNSSIQRPRLWVSLVWMVLTCSSSRQVYKDLGRNNRRFRQDNGRRITNLTYVRRSDQSTAVQHNTFDAHI